MKETNIYSFFNSDRGSILLSMLMTGMIGIFMLAQKSYWFDEAYTLYTTQTWPRLVHLSFTEDANMWLYHFFVFFWTKISSHEIWVRFLSVIFGVLSIPSIFILVKTLFNKEVAKAVVFIFPFHLLFVFFLQQARSYTMLVFFVYLSSVLFLLLLKKQRWILSLLYSVSIILGVYSHLYTLLFLFAQGFICLLYPNKKTMKYILFSWCLIILGMIPLLFSHSINGDSIGWLLKPSLSVFAGTAILLAGDYFPLFVLYGSLMLSGLWYFSKNIFKGSNEDRFPYVFILVQLVVPILVAYIVSILIKPLYQSYYFIVSVPTFLIIAIIGLYTIKRRLIRGILYFLLIAFSVLRLWGWYSEDNRISWIISNRNEEWRQAVTWIVRNYRPGDGVIFYPYYLKIPYLSYERVFPQYYQYAPVIEIASGKYLLGGGTKILPFPDSRKIDLLSNTYQRIWLVEGLINLNKKEQSQQITEIHNLLQKNFRLINTSKFYDIKLFLYTVEKGL